jgi:hypothetical protein
VVTTFEGLCHIFDFGTENTEAEAQCSGSTEGKEGRPGAMIPSGTCRIPPNINAILITDAGTSSLRVSCVSYVCCVLTFVGWDRQ